MTLPRGEWLSSGPPRRGWLSSGARPTARPMGSGWIGLVPCTVVQYTSLVRAWPSTHQDGEEKTERGQTLEEPVKGPIRRPEGNEALRGQPSTGSLDQILWSIVADCTSSTVQGGRTTCWGITTGNTRVRCSTTDGAPGGARRAIAPGAIALWPSVGQLVLTAKKSVGLGALVACASRRFFLAPASSRIICELFRQLSINILFSCPPSR